jgi:hypothetical protein
MNELEIQIEAWWDNLNNEQQNWLENKFYKDNEHGLNTLEKVIHCYNSLNKEELLILSGIKD